MGLEDLRGGSTCKFSSQCIFLLKLYGHSLRVRWVTEEMLEVGEEGKVDVVSSRVNVIYLPETTTSPEVSGHEFGFFYTRSVSDVGRVQ